ncbi:DUF262 domain-containing protein [Paenibacillus antri]|uniref:DUF262 domain-containing protein n=1 Tax=Paenibacillus antri TaxID=2582848 RepID=A0A5R9GKE4_9BACL|nr:DUF262 domain-containing protein [Paenibacillus antri]TLS52145.1 DUF262 domain-containing protein [Paenibacillus antri]
MSLEPIPIRKLIQRTMSGEIRIPAFQRGFVWSSEKVAFLLDSIYNGYPVGSILLWRTREQLASDRDLGPFILPEPPDQYPMDYVLDGQQRLTSLFGVFQTELTPSTSGDWFDVYFDIRDKQFLAIADREYVESHHFPLNTLFDSVKYRRATESFSDDEKQVVDEVQERFKEATIPVETVETPSREHVAIIFERINRAGIPLDTYQLLTAWTWSTEFDLKEKFQLLADELEPFGFGEIDSEPDLLLKCCSAVVTNSAAARDLINLNGPEVRERFEEIRNGILLSIEFLRTQLHIYSMKVLPYPAMIIPLTKFFATTRTAGTGYTEVQRRQLIKWFWRTCFARRYSSSLDRAQASDIAAMAALRVDGNQDISRFPCNVDSTFFLNNQFYLGALNTKIFIVMLAQKLPRSFLSGAAVNLAEVLKLCNRTEFHHIFPKNFLDRNGIGPKEQNVLANLCFLSNADNQRIKARSPQEYKEWIDRDQYNVILDSGLIPRDGLDLAYTDFLRERATLLTEFANTLI